MQLIAPANVHTKPCLSRQATPLRIATRGTWNASSVYGRTARHFDSAKFKPCPVRPQRKLTLQAIAADASSSSGGQSRTGKADALALGAMFVGWYLANIIFNIYNKQVLRVFPFPLTCTTVQFLVGAVMAVMFWLLGIVKLPNVSVKTILNIAPLAVVHTLGNLLTNVSLGSVAVSFTHTIKAMEPAFSVALSALFLGEKPRPLIVLSLVLIMGGVAMASMSEASFNWTGFLSAMGSNLTFQSRNVLSKKAMTKKKDAHGASEEPLDNINLFGIIQIMSLIILLPVSLYLEGWGLTPAALTAMGVSCPNEIIFKAAVTGLCFHLYQQVSYMILQRVSPVTHSIGNCVKRVVVIVASVFFFRNPVSLLNASGTGIALAGVFAYSQVKRSVKAQARKNSSNNNS